MSNKSYAEVISDTSVMIDGIRNNQGVLAKRQIDVSFADALKAELDLCIKLNNEQEALKAKLKEKTAELDGGLEAVHKRVAEAKVIIKLDIPQSAWREFGITDKK